MKIEKMTMPIYMDYSSTTPVDPRVAEKMIPFITEDFGNPASRSHPYGWTAEKAVENARKEVAKLVNADPREIIWTSGATESNNLAIKGASNFYSSKGKVIFLSNAIDFNKLMLQKNKSMLRATGNVTSKYEIISSDFLNDISYQVDLLSPSLIKEDLQGLISLNANVYNLSCLVEGKRNLDDIQVNVQNGSLNIPSIYPSPFLFETNYHNSKENSYTLDNLHLSYGKNNIGGHVLLTNLDSLSGKHKESSSIDIYLNGNQFDANPFIAYMGKTKSKSTPTKKRQTSDKLPQLKIYTKLNHVKWGEDEFNKLLVKCHTTSPTTLSIDTLKVDEDGHFMVHGIYDHAAHSLNTQTTIKQFNIK